MRILAIDTSSPASVVSVVDGERVFEAEECGDEPRHAESLLPRIRAQLEAAQLGLSELQLIAVGLGPGSFTGLRIGLATAKGLALASGIALRGVSSLQVLARGVLALDRAAIALAVIDAGRGEVLGAAYRGKPDAPLETLLAPWRAAPEAFVRRAVAHGLGPALACGSGARRYLPIFAAALGPCFALAGPELDRPVGRQLAHEARVGMQHEGASPLVALEPLYIRGSDAQLPGQPLCVE